MDTQRTDEQKVVDRLVEARLAIMAPLVEAESLSLQKVKAEIDAFIGGSKIREEIVLARQAKERDEFSERELKAHDELNDRKRKLEAKIEGRAKEYAEAFDAVRAYYASIYPVDDPAVSIRRVLNGDAHPGANVETKIDDDGNLITRIRRGLHEVGVVGASEWSPAADRGPPGVEVPEEAETAPAPSKKPWPYSFSPRVLDATEEDQDKG